MQLGSLGCQYPGKDSSSGGGFEGYRASQHRTPCSSQVLEGSRELFTQYSPITLAPVAIAIAPLHYGKVVTFGCKSNHKIVNF